MQNGRPKLLATTPLFVVSDLQRAIDFYGQKLGFADPAVWGEPPCFAMMNRDDYDLMLSLAEASTHIRPNGPNGIWDLYLKVPDLAAEAAALVEAGVKLDRGPSETEYEMMEIEITDPDGYRICIGQDIRPEL